MANGFGPTVSGRMQLALAVLLVALLLTALPHTHPRNLRPFAPHGWTAIGSAAALLVWSFAGWEAVTHLAADFRRPARDLPRATAVAVAVVGVLYLAVAATSVLVLGPAAGTSDAPLAELHAPGIGGTVHVPAAAAAVLLTLGTMNAYFAGAARLGAALGRDGALPARIDRGGSVGEVPRRSLAVVTGPSGLALAAIALGDGTAAALRLLPRGSPPHSSALLVLAALLVLTGWYLPWPLVITASALYCLRRHRAESSVTVPSYAGGGLSRIPGQAAGVRRCLVTARVPGGPPSA
ncbi:hypothetical protein SRB17_24650 [Streptomyces sp. RB17]|uniref:amino acid permease n=1 Tax=Streptomyces sp. RB17 TaxID=2585197 RepID=UPI00130C3F9E|nr:amino acid permease [Streptomyces sp. RB17]MQY34496.1 hypothetical protein [Streptomyces sp. RB17]